LTVAGRYIDKFIIVLIAGAGLLQLTDYSITYYMLHSKPYFYEAGLVGSWALSHGSIGWYLMGLFFFLTLLLVSVVAVFWYHRYKTPLLPLAAFVSLYVSEIYAVTNNTMLLIRESP
jgi:hypothetical protein